MAAEPGDHCFDQPAGGEEAGSLNGGVVLSIDAGLGGGLGGDLFGEPSHRVQPSLHECVAAERFNEGDPTFAGVVGYDVDEGGDRGVQQVVQVTRHGWLLCLVALSDEALTALYILDARDVEADPVAVARLPHYVFPGFHGGFTPRIAT